MRAVAGLASVDFDLTLGRGSARTTVEKRVREWGDSGGHENA